MPGLFVDRQKQLERIQKEVTGAASRVEDLEISRISLRTRRRSLPVPDQVLTALSQRCLPPAHLEPCATERVVGEELHNVARREELIAHRQFTAVAGGLALLTHFLAL